MGKVLDEQGPLELSGEDVTEDDGKERGKAVRGRKLIMETNESKKIIVPKSDDTVSIEAPKDGEIMVEKTLTDSVGAHKLVFGNPDRDGWGYPIKIRRTSSRPKKSR